MTISRSLSALFAIIGTLTLAAPAARTQPPAPAPTVPPLKEVPNDLDLSDPKKKVDPIVFFEAADPYGSGKLEFPTGLLRRELYRQGVLLAARDELGLTTRDGAMREAPPDDLPDLNRFRVNPRLVQTEPHEVKIEIGPTAASRVLWVARADAKPPLPVEEPSIALTRAEVFSRGGYLTALKRAGLRGTANPVDAKATVPAEVEKLLGQMTFTAQLAAVRLLHEAIRTKGESPATLGALSRAYAHLGMLTDTQWGAHPWVFKARGLLYAERIRQRDPAAPWGLWHRAYAEGLAGMHANALADLKAADGVRGKTIAPDWVGLMDALCRFDSARLKEASGDGPLGDTARVFHFLTVENRSSPHQALAAGTELVKRIPDCYRVHDALSEHGGVSAKHSSTVAGMEAMTKTFPERVADMPAVPKVVADALAPGTPEPDLVKALVEAGKSRDDRGEPSWAVLGRLAQEARVVQANGRLIFLRDTLAVSATEFLNEVKPLISDHPLAGYFETFALDRARNPAEYQKRIRALKVPELTYRHFGLHYALMTLSPEERGNYSNISVKHGDDLYYDMYLAVRNYTPDQDSTKYAWRMLAQSPYAPMARAALLLHDKSIGEAEVAAWTKEAQHPDVFLALARRALARNKPDEAEPLIRKAIQLAPEHGTYRLLAQTYKARGDTEKWLASLEEFLKEPDPGLGHAQVRVEIANHFMSKKDFQKAQPYAEAAAESWAAWAMLCACRCADGLEQWEGAEQWARRVSERYAESYHVWFFWCLRSGRGDRAAAEKVVTDHLEMVGARRSVNDILVDGVRQAAAGKPGKAAEAFLSVHQKARNDALLLSAILQYDGIGDMKQRDRLLAQLPDKSPYDPLFTLIRGKLAKGEKEVPDEETIAATLKALAPDARSFGAYVVGRFLQKRGDTKRAAEYLRRCLAESTSVNTIPSALSGLALQELEKK
ncbi:MAG TPA: hypothetical protein VKD90_23270 [Gemmataceae bacterium]|nr:hypothetical protein [Gemmataceae bacterium]